MNIQTLCIQAKLATDNAHTKCVGLKLHALCSTAVIINADLIMMKKTLTNAPVSRRESKTYSELHINA